ncbi:MAG TPA: tRNA pseudouridine(55) synthase TruB [Motilibacterales bacterium]|nr:tRNA pseudouridine(55) synthase TruB [Motilibacterales bacterium]
MSGIATESARADVVGPAEGIVIIDKPAGWTSHDVVSRMRRIAGTRRVGHAGTLDPMATGVLVVGIGRATRLLGHISGSDKTYTATIRLGWSTVTDDAEGERLAGAPADGLTLDDLAPVIASLSGPIMQRPSSVSAIKVEGRRSHDRVRSGEDVTLPERPVMVAAFDVRALRPVPELGALDVDVEVTCSSGTYIRALARDLGAALGVGGHLTALRRHRVGCFDLAEARTLEQVAEALEVSDMASVAHAAFPSVTLTAADSNAVRYGRTIELGMAWARATRPDTIAASVADPHRAALEAAHQHTPDWAEHVPPPHALFAPDGEFLALARPRPDDTAEYLAVFAQP